MAALISCPGDLQEPPPADTYADYTPRGAMETIVGCATGPLARDEPRTRPPHPSVAFANRPQSWARESCGRAPAGTDMEAYVVGAPGGAHGAAVVIGLGRIVALYYRSSTSSYQIH
jgi:hypothetical protein